MSFDPFLNQIMKLVMIEDADTKGYFIMRRFHVL